MDEQLLIQDAQQGDLNAFNQLVLTYQDLAFNVAYRVMADAASADDATQDAFIAAYRKLDTYRGGSFKAWLLRIVTNACYDELRRRKRRPAVPLEPENSDGDVLESPQWLADDAPSPENQAEQQELELAIQHCLNALDDKFRTVVVLVDVEGLDYEVTAQALNSPLGTIKSRLARARQKLQECLHGFEELLPAAFRLDDEEMP